MVFNIKKIGLLGALKCMETKRHWIILDEMLLKNFIVYECMSKNSLPFYTMKKHKPLTSYEVKNYMKLILDMICLLTVVKYLWRMILFGTWNSLIYE